MKSIKNPKAMSLMGQGSLPPGAQTVDDIVLSVAQPISDLKTNRVIRLPKVIEKTGMRRSSIYASMKNGRFPASFNLGPRCVGWLEGEIDQWIVDRMEARREN